jgi:diacylglycerol kinase family enzyme
MTDGEGRKEYFDNTLGIGFGATVTIRSHRLPILRGFLMYLTAVIQTILLDHNPIKMQIETDGEKWEQSVIYLIVCNGPREGGGFLVAPEAKIDDGIFHYAMITNVSRLMMLRIVSNKSAWAPAKNSLSPQIVHCISMPMVRSIQVLVPTCAKSVLKFCRMHLKSFAVNHSLLSTFYRRI